MAQADTIILITLCLIILYLLKLLMKKRKIEGFENDVPQERLVELNYVKKMLGLDKEPFPKCPDEDNNRCASNNREKWCMNSTKDK